MDSSDELRAMRSRLDDLVRKVDEVLSIIRRPEVRMEVLASADEPTAAISTPPKFRSSIITQVLYGAVVLGAHIVEVSGRTAMRRLALATLSVSHRLVNCRRDPRFVITGSHTLGPGASRA